MAADIAIFVSKRLQRPAAALLCLISVQALTTLSGCHPEELSAPMAARVQIGQPG